jgi:hypothetical protein
MGTSPRRCPASAVCQLAGRRMRAIARVLQEGNNVMSNRLLCSFPLLKKAISENGLDGLRTIRHSFVPIPLAFIVPIRPLDRCQPLLATVYVDSAKSHFTILTLNALNGYGESKQLVR